MVSSKASCDDTICAAGMFQIVYSPHIRLSDFLEDPLVKSFRKCQNVYSVKKAAATLRDIILVMVTKVKEFVILIKLDKHGLHDIKSDIVRRVAKCQFLFTEQIFPSEFYPKKSA